MQIKNHNVSSFYLTIISIILIFIGNSVFKEDNVTLPIMIPYLISLASAITALIFSFIGFYRKEKYRYLGAVNYIYVASCLSYFFYLLSY